MMYMHYCPSCKRMFMLNGHHIACPKCTDVVSELKISFIDYVKMDIDERKVFQANCEIEHKLNTLRTTYRMHKYSKWYREKKGSGELIPLV